MSLHKYKVPLLSVVEELFGTELSKKSKPTNIIFEFYGQHL